MILFIAMAKGKKLDAELDARIRKKIRTDLSPRHAPDRVIQVPSVPKTLNGKKVEVPIKRLLMGADPGSVLNKDSLADPASIDFYLEFAEELSGKRKTKRTIAGE